MLQNLIIVIFRINSESDGANRFTINVSTKRSIIDFSQNEAGKLPGKKEQIADTGIFSRFRDFYR